jgi:hypothetical protein
VIPLSSNLSLIFSVRSNLKAHNEDDDRDAIARHNPQRRLKGGFALLVHTLLHVMSLIGTTYRGTGAQMRHIPLKNSDLALVDWSRAPLSVDGDVNKRALGHLDFRSAEAPLSKGVYFDGH